MVGDFQKALDFVFSMEGGFSDDPSDPGGRTNLGITESEYRLWLKNPKADIENITKEQASSIYRNNYWNQVHGDFIAYPLCSELFDCAVNQGVGRSYQFLNIALGLPPIMVWSQDTSTNYHALSGDQYKKVAIKIVELRRRAYQDIVARNPSQSVFLQGWNNRLDLGKAAFGLNT